MYINSSRFYPFHSSSVRRAFDVVADKSLDGKISIAQCRLALPVLGYAQNLLSCDNLKSIILNHREAIKTLTRNEEITSNINKGSASAPKPSAKDATAVWVSFDEFCILTSYLTVLQQEIHESGCVSPIKGTNVQPPPIFLTNTPGEWRTMQLMPNVVLIVSLFFFLF